MISITMKSELAYFPHRDVYWTGYQNKELHLRINRQSLVHDGDTLRCIAQDPRDYRFTFVLCFFRGNGEREQIDGPA